MSCFKLKQKKFKNCLSLVEEKVEFYWSKPLHRWYTDHGLEHSKRIIECLEQLLQVKSSILSEAERFILLAAIYLHDIGMQFPVYAGLSKKDDYTKDELEIIRKNHNEASAKAIIASLDNNSGFSFGLENCKDYVDFIADVAKYHRKLDINTLKSVKLAGKTIRLPLLAALIRLGDELDADYRRVNPDILATVDIPAESKYHWWCHHYVQSLSIEEGIITIDFRFPEKYEKEEKLTGLIVDRVFISIKKQYEEVYDVLYKNDLHLYKDINKGKINFKRTGLYLIPDDLYKYMINLLETEENAQKLSSATHTSWFVKGINYLNIPQMIEFLNNIFKYTEEENYQKAIKEIEDYGIVNIMSSGPIEKMYFANIAGNCYYHIGNLHKAREYYNQILTLTELRAVKELYKDIVILFKAAVSDNMGLIYQDTGEPDKALESHRDALEFTGEAHYSEGQASALTNIGHVYRDKGFLEEALAYYNQALDLDKQVGNLEGEATDLGNIGSIYKLKGKIYQSLDYYQKALDIYKKTGYRGGEATAFCNIGTIYHSEGKLDDALKCNLQALEIVRTTGASKGKVITLANIGSIYSDREETEKALEYYNQALNISRDISYRHGEANQLGNIGVIYSKRGEYDKALNYLRQSLDISRESGCRQDEATALTNIGSIYRTRGDLDEAIKHFQQALDIDIEIGNLLGETQDLGNIGLIYSNKGEIEEALNCYWKVLEINKKVGSRQTEATTLGNIGSIYRSKKEPDEALKYFQQALYIYKDIGDRPGEARQLFNISVIYNEKGDLNRAFEYNMKALDIHRELEGQKEEGVNRISEEQELQEVKDPRSKKVLEILHREADIIKGIKINHLEIKGFRSLKNVIWQPGKLNIVIGPNGTGKSNLLRLLELIGSSARGQLGKSVQHSGGMGSLVWDGSMDKISFNIRALTFKENENTAGNSFSYKVYMARLGTTSNFQIEKERFLVNLPDNGQENETFDLLQRDGFKARLFYEKEMNYIEQENLPEEETLFSKTSGTFTKNNYISAIQKQLSSWAIYHNINVNQEAKIRQPIVARYEKHVDTDGQNLITVLHTLYTSDRNFKEDIDMAMRYAFSNDFEELVFPPAADQRIQIRIRWKTLNQTTSSSDISDGTLHFLFLLTVLASPYLAPVIAIDEPATYLHPSMLPVIAEYAVEASERGAQVIFTTHSTQLLDAFEDVTPTITVTKWENGETILKTIDGEELKYWLKGYSLGSLYRSGELEEM